MNWEEIGDLIVLYINIIVGISCDECSKVYKSVLFLSKNHYNSKKRKFTTDLTSGYETMTSWHKYLLSAVMSP